MERHGKQTRSQPDRDREAQTSPSPTESLLRAWGRGDQSAARRIYDSYVDHVRKVVRFHLNRRFQTRCDEDDAVQVVFLEVFRQLAKDTDGFETDESLRRWIRTVARNRTIKVIKHHSADRRSLGRENHGADADAFNAMVDLHACNRRGRASHVVESDLEDKLETLDEESRGLVEMLRASLTQEEIAQRLGCTTRTVRRRVSRLREELRLDA